MNHQSLLHPHVVQLKEVMCVPPYLAIVMEYVPGGDMFQYVVSRRGLPESEARWFFQQLILGMDYCHRKGEVLWGKVAVEGEFWVRRSLEGPYCLAQRGWKGRPA